MKKLASILILLSLVFSLAACGGGNAGETTAAGTTAGSTTGAPSAFHLSSDIRIGYFPGTTGVGLAKLIADSAANSDSTLRFIKYNSPAEITAAVSSGALDFAALPTNAFPAFYKAMNSKIQLAAINTLGVLYILTNGVNISSLADLSGKTVYVPENAPKLILQNLLSLYSIENVTISSEYDLDTLPGALVSGRASIALLPEPKATASVKQGTANNVEIKVALDLSELWDARSETKLVQGAMIVTTAFTEAHPEAVAEFLALYESSVSYMSNAENLAGAAQLTVDAGILPNAAVATSALPRCNLTFLTGNTMKNDAVGFFTALGIALPAGNAYYGAE